MRTHVSAHYRGKLVILPVDQVTHFIADHKYVAAHHPGGVLLIEDSLASLEAEFPEFIRTHRGALARRSLISGVIGKSRYLSAVMLVGVPEPVRASRRHAVTIRRLLAA